MEDESMEKVDLLPQCQICGDQRSHSSPRQRTRSWVISMSIHGILFVIMFFCFAGFYNSDSSHSKEVHSMVPTDHDAHLVGTIAAPLNHHTKYRVQTLSPNGWDFELYFGKPDYASDNAWNALIYPRSFRLHRDEAVRLNFTDSILVEPGEDYGTMLGVMHNLHCLRRIRQMLYSDYYYPNSPEDELAHNREHSHLNPHPYYFAGLKYHPIAVSPKVTRKCANWEALQQVLEPRNFEAIKLMNDTGPPS